MKKTAFDKIVVGFVVLVVIIFALLMVYSISTAQNSVLSERKSTMKNEITMLADGAMTDYSNGTIDSKELYKELQHAADTLDMGIWLTDERSNIIFRSGSSSGSSESGGSSKDSDSHSSTNDNLKNYVEPDELFASFCFEDTFGGYFSEDTLVIGPASLLVEQLHGNYHPDITYDIQAGYKEQDAFNDICAIPDPHADRHDRAYAHVKQPAQAYT